MSRYRLSHAAAADIGGIRSYTQERWGDDRARVYLTELRDRIRWLAKSPARGKDRQDLGERLHSYPQGRHIIYYRLAGDGIEVVRVLHQRMDAPRHL